MAAPGALLGVAPDSEEPAPPPALLAPTLTGTPTPSLAATSTLASEQRRRPSPAAVNGENALDTIGSSTGGGGSCGSTGARAAVASSHVASAPLRLSHEDSASQELWPISDGGTAVAGTPMLKNLERRVAALEEGVESLGIELQDTQARLDCDDLGAAALSSTAQPRPGQPEAESGAAHAWSDAQRELDHLAHEVRELWRHAKEADARHSEFEALPSVEQLKMDAASRAELSFDTEFTTRAVSELREELQGFQRRWTNERQEDHISGREALAQMRLSVDALADAHRDRLAAIPGLQSNIAALQENAVSAATGRAGLAARLAALEASTTTHASSSSTSPPPATAGGDRQENEEVDAGRSSLSLERRLEILEELQSSKSRAMEVRYEEQQAALDMCRETLERQMSAMQHTEFVLEQQRGQLEKLISLEDSHLSDRLLALENKNNRVDEELEELRRCRSSSADSAKACEAMTPLLADSTAAPGRLTVLENQLNTKCGDLFSVNELVGMLEGSKTTIERLDARLAVMEESRRHLTGDFELLEKRVFDELKELQMEYKSISRTVQGCESASGNGRQQSAVSDDTGLSRQQQGRLTVLENELNSKCGDLFSVNELLGMLEGSKTTIEQLDGRVTAVEESRRHLTGDLEVLEKRVFDELKDLQMGYKSVSRFVQGCESADGVRQQGVVSDEIDSSCQRQGRLTLLENQMKATHSDLFSVNELLGMLEGSKAKIESLDGRLTVVEESRRHLIGDHEMLEKRVREDIAELDMKYKSLSRSLHGCEAVATHQSNRGVSKPKQLSRQGSATDASLVESCVNSFDGMGVLCTLDDTGAFTANIGEAVSNGCDVAVPGVLWDAASPSPTPPRSSVAIRNDYELEAEVPRLASEISKWREVSSTLAQAAQARIELLSTEQDTLNKQISSCAHQLHSLNSRLQQVVPKADFENQVKAIAKQIELGQRDDLHAEVMRLTTEMLSCTEKLDGLSGRLLQVVVKSEAAEERIDCLSIEHENLLKQVVQDKLQRKISFEDNVQTMLHDQNDWLQQFVLRKDFEDHAKTMSKQVDQLKHRDELEAEVQRLASEVSKCREVSYAQHADELDGVKQTEDLEHRNELEADVQRLASELSSWREVVSAHHAELTDKVDGLSGRMQQAVPKSEFDDIVRALRQELCAATQASDLRNLRETLFAEFAKNSANMQSADARVEASESYAEHFQRLEGLIRQLVPHGEFMEFVSESNQKTKSLMQQLVPRDEFMAFVSESNEKIHVMHEKLQGVADVVVSFASPATDNVVSHVEKKEKNLANVKLQPAQEQATESCVEHLQRLECLIGQLVPRCEFMEFVSESNTNSEKIMQQLVPRDEFMAVMSESKRKSESLMQQLVPRDEFMALATQSKTQTHVMRETSQGAADMVGSSSAIPKSESLVSHVEKQKANSANVKMVSEDRFVAWASESDRRAKAMHEEIQGLLHEVGELSANSAIQGLLHDVGGQKAHAASNLKQHAMSRDEFAKFVGECESQTLREELQLLSRTIQELSNSAIRQTDLDKMGAAMRAQIEEVRHSDERLANRTPVRIKTASSVVSGATTDVGLGMQWSLDDDGTCTLAANIGNVNLRSADADAAVESSRCSEKPEALRRDFAAFSAKIEAQIASIFSTQSELLNMNDEHRGACTCLKESIAQLQQTVEDNSRNNIGTHIAAELSDYAKKGVVENIEQQLILLRHDVLSVAPKRNDPDGELEVLKRTLANMQEELACLPTKGALEKSLSSALNSEIQVMKDLFQSLRRNVSEMEGVHGSGIQSMRTELLTIKLSIANMQAEIGCGERHGEERTEGRLVSLRNELSEVRISLNSALASLRAEPHESEDGEMHSLRRLMEDMQQQLGCCVTGDSFEELQTQFEGLRADLSAVQNVHDLRQQVMTKALLEHQVDAMGKQIQKLEQCDDVESKVERPALDITDSHELTNHPSESVLSATQAEHANSIARTADDVLNLTKQLSSCTEQLNDLNDKLQQFVLKSDFESNVKSVGWQIDQLKHRDDLEALRTGETTTCVNKLALEVTRLEKEVKQRSDVCSLAASMEVSVSLARAAQERMEHLSAEQANLIKQITSCTDELHGLKGQLHNIKQSDDLEPKIKQLETEIIDLHRLIKNASDTAPSLENVENVNSIARAAQEQVERLSAHHADLTVQMSSCTQKLDSLDNRLHHHAELAAEVRLLASEISDCRVAQSSVKQLASELSRLEQLIKQGSDGPHVGVPIDVSVSLAKAAHDRLESLSAQSADLTREVSSCTVKLDGLDSQLQEVVVRSESAQERLNCLSTEHTNLWKQMSSCTDKLAATDVKLHDQNDWLQSKHLEQLTRRDALEAEIQRLASEVLKCREASSAQHTNLTRELASLTNRLDDVNGRLTHTGVIEATNTMLYNQIDRLEKGTESEAEFRRLSTEIAQIQREMKHVSHSSPSAAQVERMSSIGRIAQEGILGISAQQADLVKQVSSWARKIDDLNDRLQQGVEVTGIRKQIDDVDQRLENEIKQRSDVDSLAASVEVSVSLARAAQERIEHLSAEQANLVTQITSYTDELHGLKGQVQSIKQSDDLQPKMKQLATEIVDLHRLIKHASDTAPSPTQVENAISIARTTQEQMVVLQNKVEGHVTSMNSLIERIECGNESETELKRLTGEIAQIQRKMQHVSDSTPSPTQVETMNSTSRIAQEAMLGLSAHQADLVKQMSSCTVRIDDLNNRLQQVVPKSEFEHQVKSMCRQIEQIKQRDEPSADVKQLALEVTRLEHEIKQQGGCSSSMAAPLEVAMSLARAAQERVEGLSTAHANLENQMSSCADQLHTLNKRLQQFALKSELEDHAKAMSNHIDKMDHSYELENGRLQQFVPRSEFVKLREEINGLRKDALSSSPELNGIRKEVSSMSQHVQSRIETLASSFDQLAQRLSSCVSKQNEFGDRLQQIAIHANNSGEQLGRDMELQLGVLREQNTSTVGSIAELRKELTSLGQYAGFLEGSKGQAIQSMKCGDFALCQAQRYFSVNAMPSNDEALGRLSDSVAQLEEQLANQVSSSRQEIRKGLVELESRFRDEVQDIVVNIRELQSKASRSVPDDSSTGLLRLAQRVDVLEEDMVDRRKPVAPNDVGPQMVGLQDVLFRVMELEAISGDALRRADQMRDSIDRNMKRTSQVDEWVKSLMNQHGDSDRRLQQLEKRLQIGLRGVEEPMEEALSQLAVGVLKMAQLLGVTAEDAVEKLGWRDACADLPRMMDHAWLRSRLPKRASVLKLLRQKAEAETVRELQSHVEALAQSFAGVPVAERQPPVLAPQLHARPPIERPAERPASAQPPHRRPASQGAWRAESPRTRQVTHRGVAPRAQPGFEVGSAGSVSAPGPDGGSSAAASPPASGPPATAAVATFLGQSIGAAAAAYWPAAANFAANRETNTAWRDDIGPPPAHGMSHYAEAPVRFGDEWYGCIGTAAYKQARLVEEVEGPEADDESAQF